MNCVINWELTTVYLGSKLIHYSIVIQKTVVTPSNVSTLLFLCKIKKYIRFYLETSKALSLFLIGVVVSVSGGRITEKIKGGER